jgi:hypothetical protein
MEFGIFVIIVQLGWILVRLGDVRDILHRIYRLHKETNPKGKK